MRMISPDCDCSINFSDYGMRSLEDTGALAGLLALTAYLTVGVVIPMWNGKRGSQKGMEFRTGFKS